MFEVFSGRLRRFLLLATGVSLPLQQILAEETFYCAQPVEIDRVNAPSPINLSQGPSRFLLSDRTETPIAVDSVRTPAEDPKYVNSRLVLWLFGPERQFQGPYDLQGFMNGRDLVGTDGSFVYLKHGAQYATPGSTANSSSDERWEQRLFVIPPGGRPEMVEGPLLRAGWKQRAWHFDDRLDGVIVTMSHNPPSGPQQTENFLVKGSAVQPIEEGRPRGGTFLSSPKWGVDILADSWDVEMTDRKTGATTHLELPQAGDDERWNWESLHIDRYGWLFAEGNGNDYAVKLGTENNRVTAESVYKYTGHTLLGRLINWLFGKNGKTSIDRTFHSKQCVQFSPTLELTIFCKPMKVLVEGELEDIGDGSAPLESYLGDSQSAAVALFKGTDNGLYAFDGKRTQLIRSEMGRWINVQDLSEQRKTFVVAGNRSFQLTGRFPTLRLRPIVMNSLRNDKLKNECCLSLGTDFSGALFKAFPGTNDVLLFSSATGVWQLGGKTPKLVWQTGDSPISLPKVSSAKKWESIVFLTADNRPYRINSCRQTTPR